VSCSREELGLTIEVVLKLSRSGVCAIASGLERRGEKRTVRKERKNLKPDLL
jgi:hypothetical protein